VAVVFGNALLACGQFHDFLRNTLISTAILITGKIVLTAKFGMNGAGVATSSAEAAMMFPHWTSLYKVSEVLSPR
jgi:O-antigen/teichoic acid export membrane protein